MLSRPARVLDVAGSAWTTLFGVGYVVLVRSQDGVPSALLLVPLGVAVLAGVAAAVGIHPRTLLLVAIATTGAGMIMGLLSIGILLAPAVVAFALALARTPLTTTAQKAARTAAMS